MDKYVCRECGEEFNSSFPTRYCNSCRKSGASSRIIRICRICGQQYYDNPKRKVCKECAALPFEQIEALTKKDTKQVFDRRHRPRERTDKVKAIIGYTLENQDKTLSQIGEKFGVTKEYIRQVLARDGIERERGRSKARENRICDYCGTTFSTTKCRKTTRCEACRDKPKGNTRKILEAMEERPGASRAEISQIVYGDATPAHRSNVTRVVLNAGLQRLRKRKENKSA